MKYRENLSHLSLCCFVIYVHIEREQALRGAAPGGGGVERKESLQVRPREIWISASKKSMRNADWRKSDSSVAEVELKVEFKFQTRMQL